MSKSEENFGSLMRQVRQCTLCADHLPHPPNPVLAASADASLVIIGQAPGIKAHASSMPWNDASGDRLRNWLGIDRNTFYNTKGVALIPMGFCFPGYVRGADAPPRKECAPTWHSRLLNYLQPSLTLLVGRYAQHYYLPEFKTLTQAVDAKATFTSSMMVLPHPSGRNNRWLAKNPWFETRVLPRLKQKVQALQLPA